VQAGEDPRLVDLLNDIATELAEVNGGYRLAVARVLRDEGLTLTRIAGTLRVTRQRVATLLAGEVATTGELRED
jgi:plasmid maintenance system antidote protein VapI